MREEDIDSLIRIFCDIDNFCKDFEPEWQKIFIELYKNFTQRKQRNRKTGICLSEIMTITIFFHKTGYRTFKDYYNRFVSSILRPYFRKLPSYSRFINLVKRCFLPLAVFLRGCCGKDTGISFIDSTILTVCHARRIHSHKVFKGIAKRGKTSTGWFYGFKLHLIINDKGEILAYMLTPGNIDDRSAADILSKDILGKLFGDKGYISHELFVKLYERGLSIITRLKLNMKNKLMSIVDKILLRRRGIIESVHNKLKNGCQIEHHRHRSRWNFLVNLVSGLIAYAYEPQKPTIRLKKNERRSLVSLIAA
jgi:hypothetical protein